jgi:hypothetical protein
MESANVPKFDPALLKGTWWTTFNGQSEEANFHVLLGTLHLPGAVQAALATCIRNISGLGEEDVNWNVTCMAQDGHTVLRHADFLEGGSRSGSSCGENDLWAVSAGKNKKGTPSPKGSAAFGYLDIIYVIDGGLCPCLRCAKSLLGLATRLNSTIIVRPLTDYALIAQGRTPLILQETFLLLFRPNAATFVVCHTAPGEAPRALVNNRGPIGPARFTCPTAGCTDVPLPANPRATKNTPGYCQTHGNVVYAYSAGTLPW